MSFIQRAIWFVESHSREEITLEDIAAACNVSPYHLTRTFATTMGVPVMRYVRGRRLSEAAKRLVLEQGGILDLALTAGYNSHEAFTRAFREQFDLTPEQLRAQGHLNNINLIEAIPMSTTKVGSITKPRFETLKPRTLAGIVEKHDCAAPMGIPAQWQKFLPHIGHIAGQVDDVAYGVNYNFDAEGNFDHMCGVEVEGTQALPKGLTRLSFPMQKYAVFTHADHISKIRETFSAIWSKWLPESGYHAAEAPNLERYAKEFNPTTGLGGFEIWIPIKN